MFFLRFDVDRPGQRGVLLGGWSQRGAILSRSSNGGSPSTRGQPAGRLTLLELENERTHKNCPRLLTYAS